MRQPDRSDVIALGAIATGAAFTLWMGRGLTFFSDEWAFIEHRSLGDPATWMPPHNEHWATIPVIAYRLLIETIGLQTYVPYLLCVVALHVIVVWLTYRMVRRTAGGAGPALGVGAAILLAFLGSGFENLLWGFQTGFVGATAAALGALTLLERGRTPARAASVVALLVGALMTAGIALVFLAAVALEILLRARWRRWLPIVAVPAAVYAGWFLVWGRAGVGTFRDPFTVASLSRIPQFVAEGSGNAVGSVLGVGPVLGVAAAAIVAAAIGVFALRRRELPVRTVSALAALALLYALIAVSRAGVMEGQVQYTRYTYVAVVLLVVGIAPVVGPAVARLWATRPRQRPALLGSGALVLVLGLLWNVRLFEGGRQIFLDRAAFTRALITIAQRDPLPDGADPDASLVYVPSPASLDRITREHGSPLSDVLVPGAVETPDAATFARAEEQVRDPKVPLPEDVD